MMKETQKQETADIDQFDDTVSLHQLIPTGKGKGESLLKTIVNSIHNTNNGRLPSVLIIGPEGNRTHAKAFIRAMGVDDIDEIHSSLLQPSIGLTQFFHSANQYKAHLITNAERLMPMVQHAISQILKRREFNLYNFLKEGNDKFEVPGLLVLTAKDINRVAEPIHSNVDYIVELEPYTHEQLLLVILQRLKYAHIEYESEEVLDGVVECGCRDLREIIQFLKVCIAVMQAEGREEKLLLDDVKRAARMV